MTVTTMHTIHQDGADFYNEHGKCIYTSPQRVRDGDTQAAHYACTAFVQWARYNAPGAPLLFQWERTRCTPALTTEERARIATSVLSRVLIERRLVWALIDTLMRAGFSPVCVRADEDTATSDARRMFDEVFALDQADCIFVNASGKERGLRLVLGNDGIDALADWTCPKDTTDGWNAALEAFSVNTERFIQ